MCFNNSFKAYLDMCFILVLEYFLYFSLQQTKLNNIYWFCFFSLLFSPAFGESQNRITALQYFFCGFVFAWLGLLYKCTLERRSIFVYVIYELLLIYVVIVIMNGSVLLLFSFVDMSLCIVNLIRIVIWIHSRALQYLVYVFIY